MIRLILNNVFILPRFTPTDTVLFASSVIRHLFDRIESGRTPEKLAENDYLMKCMYNSWSYVLCFCLEFLDMLFLG